MTYKYINTDNKLKSSQMMAPSFWNG